MAECSVYVIGFDLDKAPSKVGIASDPLKRMASLQTAHYQKLVMAGWWNCPDRDMARYLERAFHEVQHRERLSGEWFDLSPKACMILLMFGLGAALDVHTDMSQQEIDEILKTARVEHSDLGMPA